MASQEEEIRTQTYWAGGWDLSAPVRNQAEKQGVSLNAMCLKYPEAISPTLVHGKIAFHETGPWCQTGWGLLL